MNIAFPAVLLTLLILPGILLSYSYRRGSFDRQGELDRIVLTNAQRRDLSTDRKEGEGVATPEEDPRFYPVESDFLVLKYTSIFNLSVEYAILD